VIELLGREKRYFIAALEVRQNTSLECGNARRTLLNQLGYSMVKRQSVV